MTLLFLIPIFLISALGVVVATALHLLGFSFFDLRPLRPRFWPTLGLQIVAHLAWGLPTWLVIVWWSGLSFNDQMTFYASGLSSIATLLDRYMLVLLLSQALYFLVLWQGTRLISPLASQPQSAQALVPLGIIGVIILLMTVGPPLYMRTRLGAVSSAAGHHTTADEERSATDTTREPPQPETAPVRRVPDPAAGVPSPSMANAPTEELTLRLLALAARTITTDSYSYAINIVEGGCDFGEAVITSPASWRKSWDGSYADGQDVRDGLHLCHHSKPDA
jgi:hypothetical protein